MRKIAVLGGGVYQLPLITKAVERGLYVYAASLDTGDPGMKYAHERWAVDLTDHDAILDLIQKNGVEAVATTGTEFSIPTIGYLREKLGLPGVSMETARLSTNKVLAQEKFAEAAVPAARFRRVSSYGEAADAAREVGWPVYVKAPDSSGSRGITCVEDVSGLEAAFTEALSYSKSGSVLIEEQLCGLEFGAQVIVIDGEAVECICHNDTVTPPPVTVPVGHSAPFMASEAIAAEARDVCAAAAKALKIENAVCNADLIATPDGVKIFELGARIGATGIAEIIALHHGIDLYDIALSMALGERPAIARPEPGPAAAYHVIAAPASGTLARCVAPPEVSGLPGVVDVRFDYKPGATVRKFRTGPDRIGHVLVTADTAGNAEALALRVIDMLEIEVTP